MKSKLSFIYLIFFLSFNSYGQNDLKNLNGYKIIYLPKQYGNIDIYIENKFKKIGFIVYRDETQLTNNTVFKEDPNLTLICQIDHSYSYPHTTIGIKLENANSEVIYENSDDSRGKAFVSFDVGNDQIWVIDRVFTDLDLLDYHFNIDLSLSKRNLLDLPSVEITSETEETIKSYLSNNKLDDIEGIFKSYQSELMPNFYKIGIIRTGDKFKAIIIETDSKYWKQGEVKAVFEPSSMKGFYSVKWYAANKITYETFALMENEALLSLEFNDLKTGEKKQDKFIKMFPISSDQSNFKKDNTKTSGSGFFLTTEGIIATNAHVVEGASNIEVTVSNEVGIFTYKTKILLVDNKNDVALLQIDDEKFKGLTSIPYGVTENSEVGSKVFTIGYPLNDVMGNNYKVTDGIISAKSGIGDDVRYYQISVPLQPGNSGGPLFNKEGNIIGITSAKLNGQAVGVQIENVNYAIKSAYLLNLYNMLPNSTKLLSTSKISTKELEDQIKVLKNYVCLIKIF